MVFWHLISYERRERERREREREERIKEQKIKRNKKQKQKKRTKKDVKSGKNSSTQLTAYLHRYIHYVS